MGQAVRPAARGARGSRRQPAMAGGRVQRPVDRGLSRPDGSVAVRTPLERASLPSPDLPLLGALYVLEAAAWLAIVASFRAGVSPLAAALGDASGAVFVLACLVGALAAGAIVWRHRRTRRE